MQGGEGGARGGAELRRGAVGAGLDVGGVGVGGGGRPRSCPSQETAGQEDSQAGEQTCPGAGGSPDHRPLCRPPSLQSSPPASSSVRSSLHGSPRPSQATSEIRSDLELSWSPSILYRCK